MEIDPTLFIIVGGSVGALFIERIFYYRLKYKEKKVNSGNPGHGERIGILETEIVNIKDDITEIKDKLK